MEHYAFFSWEGRRNGPWRKKVGDLGFCHISRFFVAVTLPALALTGCAGGQGVAGLPFAFSASVREGAGEGHMIGPPDGPAVFLLAQIGQKYQF
ncbi:MAG: hypothetical protein AB7D33_14775 [Sphingobium sp.]